jgi:hypothetical protein
MKTIKTKLWNFNSPRIKFSHILWVHKKAGPPERECDVRLYCRRRLCYLFMVPNLHFTSTLLEPPFTLIRSLREKKSNARGIFAFQFRCRWLSFYMLKCCARGFIAARSRLLIYPHYHHQDPRGCYDILMVNRGLIALTSFSRV